MIIELTRKLKVDTENIPDDLSERVQKAFAEYTHGTAKAYQYQDKLSFIDLMVERFTDTDYIYEVNYENQSYIYSREQLFNPGRNSS